LATVADDRLTAAADPEAAITMVQAINRIGMIWDDRAKLDFIFCQVGRLAGFRLAG